ncbi:thiolase family protein [Dactylosporangium sp. CA-233914]|uniref:thiolase family protein n=1 Tax=Dactylosporangium sp. CA-233914 TaxID=3239934 RepID=UPI003D8D31E7
MSSAAVTGIADSRLGNVARSPIQTCVDVAVEATADAGVGLDEIDGLISFGVLAAENGRDVHRHHIRLAEQLGLGPLRWTGTSKLGGGAAGQTLREAALLAAAGKVRHALVVAGDSFRTGLGRDNAQGAWMDFHDQELEGPYGHTAPGQWAMVTQRYAHRHGWSREELDEALAQVAVSARQWAVLNPASAATEQLTVPEVLASPLVADPIRVLHCSRSIDGASAFVVSATSALTSAQRDRSVPVLGTGTRYSHYYMGSFPELDGTVTDLARASFNEAYEEAGLGPDDIDIFYPYDGFAYMPLYQLEAAGFAEPGRAVHLYREGATSPGGRLPCNTHGGALNHGLPAFPAVLFFLTEAVRQLRGEAGERQVDGARHALLHGLSGCGGMNASFLLGAAS